MDLHNNAEGRDAALAGGPSASLIYVLHLRPQRLAILMRSKSAIGRDIAARAHRRIRSDWILQQAKYSEVLSSTMLNFDVTRVTHTCDASTPLMSSRSKTAA